MVFAWRIHGIKKGLEKNNNNRVTQLRARASGCLFWWSVSNSFLVYISLFSKKDIG